MTPTQQEAYRLIEDGDDGRAARLVERLLRWSPDDAEAHHLAGVLATRAHDLERGEVHARHACRLGGSKAHWRGLGFNLAEQRRFAEAAEAYEALRRLDADPADIDYHQGMCRLSQGQWQCGWALYERRLDRRSSKFSVLAPARWRGEPLNGGKLVVVSEQGLGDNIQFARYLPALAAVDGTVEFSCYPRLMPLLAPLVPGTVTPSTTTCNGHRFTTLISLFGILAGAQRPELPAPAYLSADPGLRAELAGATAAAGLKVGIAWCGSPTHTRDFARSCDPEHFAPLARVPGISLFGLLPSPARPLLPEAVALLAGDLGPLMTDFTRTAALLANLDLVISVDTATAHLAGALGVPTWLLLPYSPDWRWEMAGDTTGWYASARLWHQPAPGAWDRLFAAMVEPLAALAAYALRR